MNDVTLLNVAMGINNKVVSHRLPFDKNGISAFESAMDVLIDSTGEVISRRGNTLLASGVFHSGWETSDGFYCIQDRDTDSALMKAIVTSGEIELVGIRDSMTIGAKCSYMDLAGKTYYMNGYERGVISNGVSSSWQEQDWTGPETTSEMLGMPTGAHLDMLSGHMLVAVGDELFHSEHGLLNLTDNLKNRVRFESNITMLIAVQSGVFVSDERSIYFLSNPDPNQWMLKRVSNYPGKGRGQTLVDPSFFGIETNQLSALMATTQGQCIGLPDGTLLNLINKNLTLPANCGSGAIMVVDETTILQS